jgi:hypothetical protein
MGDLMNYFNVQSEDEFFGILDEVMYMLDDYGYGHEGHDDIPFEVFEMIFNDLGYDLPMDIYDLLTEFA